MASRALQTVAASLPGDYATIHTLPDEILLMIFKHLKPRKDPHGQEWYKDMRPLALTSKRIRPIAQTMLYRSISIPTHIESQILKLHRSLDDRPDLRACVRLLTFSCSVGLEQSRLLDSSKTDVSDGSHQPPSSWTALVESLGWMSAVLYFGLYNDQKGRLLPIALESMQNLQILFVSVANTSFANMMLKAVASLKHLRSLTVEDIEERELDAQVDFDANLQLETLEILCFVGDDTLLEWANYLPFRKSLEILSWQNVRRSTMLDITKGSNLEELLAPVESTLQQLEITFNSEELTEDELDYDNVPLSRFSVSGLSALKHLVIKLYFFDLDQVTADQLFSYLFAGSLECLTWIYVDTEDQNPRVTTEAINKLKDALLLSKLRRFTFILAIPVEDDTKIKDALNLLTTELETKEIKVDIFFANCNDKTWAAGWANAISDLM